MSKVAESVFATERSLVRRRPGGKMSVSEEVKGLRAKFGMSQREFADAFGISLASIQTWESTSREVKPDISARLLLDMIKTDPEAVLSLVRKIKTARLRESLMEEA